MAIPAGGTPKTLTVKDIVPGQGKAAKKATPAKKGTHGAPAGKRAKAASARQESKTAAVLDLVKRPGGATLKALMKATGWQPHSVRGAISGTLKKKLGLVVTSEKMEGRGRVYRVAP